MSYATILAGVVLWYFLVWFPTFMGDKGWLDEDILKAMETLYPIWAFLIAPVIVSGALW